MNTKDLMKGMFEDMLKSGEISLNTLEYMLQRVDRSNTVEELDQIWEYSKRV